MINHVFTLIEVGLLWECDMPLALNNLHIPLLYLYRMELLSNQLHRVLRENIIIGIFLINGTS